MRKLIPLTAAIAAIIASTTTYSATPLEIREISPQIPLEHYTPNDILVNPRPKEADIEIHTSGAHYYKQAITSTKPRTTSSEKFT